MSWSWEADTVQENRPLATDLFSRWQFQSNSHPASQWLWPPNISITSSSSGLPQPVTRQRGKVALIPADARFYALKGMKQGRRGVEKGMDSEETRWTHSAVRKPPDTLQPLLSVVGLCAPADEMESEACS
ncbi:unnamed protein product [Pleuronectes platessa]|uniref:Uncharacterized protein n=1 Tax=Pleuronectes platessa TaxID=8262 RepID=A0A9N7UEC9_PLEPL|nr:unnamed protein product [Pleuronectes platessa]